MKRSQWLFALLPVFTLCACTHHLTQQECQLTDWHQVGMSDGSAGKYKRDLSLSIQDCAKFNLSVDNAAYDKGWRAGTRQFCQPGHAYSMGAKGETYNNICPADMASKFANEWHRGAVSYCTPDTGYNLGRSGQGMPSFCSPNQQAAFANAYQSGRRIYDNEQELTHRINDAQNNIRRIDDDIRRTRNQINDINNRIASPNNSQENRLRDMNEVNNLQGKMRELEHDKDRNEDQLAEAQRQLSKLRLRNN